jgi:hypothetical protein
VLDATVAEVEPARRHVLVSATTAYSWGYVVLARVRSLQCVAPEAEHHLADRGSEAGTH